MKVYTYGNVLNNSYNLTRFLRAKGVDAEMFLDDAAPGGQNYPWWEDTELSADTLPAWIHYHRVGRHDFLRRSPAFKRMAEAFRGCDIALTCSWGPILSEAAGVPNFFYSYGDDLQVAHTTKEIADGVRRFADGYKPGLRGLAIGWSQRHALVGHVDRVGISNGHQVEAYARPLGLLPKTVLTRLAWDLDAYAPRESAELSAKYAGYDFVCFMLARHTWRSVWCDLKGNDKFIRAYARFVRDTRRPTKLVMVEKGPDVEASKALVRELGIEAHVEWIGEQNKDGMRAYYSVPNVVVVDQFWHDDWLKRYPGDAPLPRVSFGSGAIEAMAAKRPLITACFNDEMYGGEMPPVLRAFREDEILARLQECAEMGLAGRRDAADRAHAFARRCHDWRVTTDLYIAHLRDVLEKRG